MPGASPSREAHAHEPADGPGLAPGQLGDLAVAVALEQAQGEHLPLVRGERADAAQDGLAGVGLVDGGLAAVGGLVVGGATLALGSALVGAHLVGAAVADDPVEPGLERGVSIAGGCRRWRDLGQAEEGLLDHVLGCAAGAQECPRMAEERALEAVDEGLERLEVPGTPATEEDPRGGAPFPGLRLGAV